MWLLIIFTCQVTGETATTVMTSSFTQQVKQLEPAKKVSREQRQQQQKQQLVSPKWPFTGQVIKVSIKKKSVQIMMSGQSVMKNFHFCVIKNHSILLHHHHHQKSVCARAALVIFYFAGWSINNLYAGQTLRDSVPKEESRQMLINNTQGRGGGRQFMMIMASSGGKKKPHANLHHTANK